MKIYHKTLAFLSIVVASTSAFYRCSQPLEFRQRNQVILEYHKCEQVVDQAALQHEPNIIYHDSLFPDEKYSLLLLENNKNSSSYSIHWFITDIIPVNRSLTIHKKILSDYRPPNSANSTTYTVLVYKHPSNLTLPAPSPLESWHFIPHKMEVGFSGLRLEANSTFTVSGRNTSQMNRPGIPQPPYYPPQFQPQPQPQPTNHVYPTSSTQYSSYHPVRNHSVTSSFVNVSNRTGGYFSYNINNHTGITTHKPHMTTHKRKNSAERNLLSLKLLVIALFVVTKVSV